MEPIQHDTLQRFFRPIVSLIVLVVLLAFLPHVGALSPVAAVHAQSSAAQITLAPNPVSISGCGPAYVDVWVQDVTNLYGADVRISFDPAVLEVIDADSTISGVQLELLSGFLSPDYPVRNEANNTLGTIWVAVTQLNPTEPVSGSGAIVRVHLRAKSGGTSALQFTYTKLSTRDGIAIPSIGVGGSAEYIAPAAPVLSITRLNSTTARLTWTGVPGSSEYRLYRDTQPYSSPGLPLLNTASLTFDDTGALGSTEENYFYTVDAVCPDGTASTLSNRVGEFDFTLLRNASNMVGIPLSDPTLTNADALASLTGATRVSSWNPVIGGFVTRLVGLGGPNFPITTAAGYMVYTPNAGPTVFTTAGDVPAAGSVQFSVHRLASCAVNLITIPLDRPSIITADGLALDMGGVPRISVWQASIGSYATRITGALGTNFATRTGYPYWPCANTSGGGSVWP